MAEIHCIAPEIDADQAHNLVRSLTDLIAGGGDPGSRDAQIRSLGQTLKGSMRVLRAEFARLGLPEAATRLDRDQARPRPPGEGGPPRRRLRSAR